MGIFDFLKGKKKEKENIQYAKMLSGDIPLFSQFGTDIYSSDVVQQAMYAIVTEMKKLRPKHVRRSANSNDFIPIRGQGSVQAVLDNPNYLMTTSDFIEKIVWQLLLNYNSFVYLERDSNNRLVAMYPIQPTQVDFLDSAGSLFVKMYFKNGESYILPYDNLIHLKTHYSLSDLMGGDENGQPNNGALLQTLQLNDTLLKGVQKALTSSFAINGIVKYNTLLDDGTAQKDILDFETKLKSNTSGFLPMDLKSEIIPFNRDIKIVDEATLKFIDSKILRHIGTPIEILEGNYDEHVYEAWYQRTLEPLIINMSEGFTKRIFTDRQVTSFDNQIYFYQKELSLMSTSQTLQLVHELGQTGTLLENEKRVAFGFEPLAELEGIRLMSLNYANALEKQTAAETNTNTENTGGANE